MVSSVENDTFIVEIVEQNGGTILNANGDDVTDCYVFPSTYLSIPVTVI